MINSSRVVLVMFQNRFLNWNAAFNLSKIKTIRENNSPHQTESIAKILQCFTGSQKSCHH